MEVHKPQSKRGKLVIESSPPEDLNDDLIIEIFCRLPYKDVVRCNCVSKIWFSLIRNPQFVARFSSMNKLPWTFIYNVLRFKKLGKKGLPNFTSSDDLFKSPGFSFSFLPFHKAGRSRIRVLKTYNDLVLCCDEAKDEDLSTHTVCYICNPLTMQWVSLPPVPESELGDCFDFICELTEDYYKKHHECRFSVVRVARLQSKTIRVHIFSSGIGRWKKKKISTSMSISDDIIYVNDAVICNNKLIILGGLFLRRMNISIVIFDIFNGEISSVNHYHHHMFPMSRDFNFYHPFYHGIGLRRMAEGRLRLAGVFLLENHPVIKIWELGEENSYEWRLMQEVSLKDVVSECKWVSEYLKRTFKYAYEPSVFGFDPNDVNILYINLKCEGCIGKYDIQRKSLNIANPTQVAFNGNVKLLVLQLWPTPLPPQLQFGNHN